MKKYIGVIGLAKRAGKLACGTESVVDAIRAKKASLVIVASDVSNETKKRIVDKCSFYGVDITTLEEGKSELGTALGRNDTAAAAFLDASFVKAFHASLAREKTSTRKEISNEE